MMTSPSLPRRAGRPSTLSSDLIVSEALALLDEVGVQTFSVSKLARRLNVSAMSFYNYFSSVDDLLHAVADRVFTLFDMPEPVERWQDFLLAWLRAMAVHVRRYPVALKVIAWNGTLSAGWLRSWLPVLEIIAHHEKDTRRRKSIAYWLSLSAIGIMNARVNEPSTSSLLPDELMTSLPEVQRELLRLFYGGGPPSDGARVMDHAFVTIVAELERIFEGHGPLGERKY
jgi:AcrR family transcriptional regulator